MQAAWLKVGSCGNGSEWQQGINTNDDNDDHRGGSTQLASVAYPGLCLNVFGGPPACCPGGADSNPAKFHLTKCGGGPGNQFNFTAQGQLALVGASKWSACEGLCIAPTTTVSPLVSLGNCSASDPQWVRVQV